MTNRELEILLIEKCESQKLKTTAFDSLKNVFLNNTTENLDLSGFDRAKIKEVFEGFQYYVGRQKSIPIIRTRIGLYLKKDDDEHLPKIGHYELETDFNGEILDDYFVIY